jgi:hypothetical protein
MAGYIAIFHETALSQERQTGTDDERILLLSRLNLDFPGLERVKATAEEPETAMKKLLVYFRNGGAGKHPLNKNTKAGFRGNCASAKGIGTDEGRRASVFYIYDKRTPSGIRLPNKQSGCKRYPVRNSNRPIRK